MYNVHLNPTVVGTPPDYDQGKLTSQVIILETAEVFSGALYSFKFVRCSELHLAWKITIVEYNKYYVRI
jgi:hypothetical protein